MFSGSLNSWVTVADSPSLDLTSGMTLEAWVDPTSLNSPDAGWCAALSKEHQNSSNDISYALYAANGTGAPPSGRILVGSMDNGAQGRSVLPLNTWTFLSATYDGTTLKMYVNGTQVGSTTAGGNIFTTGDPLRIGGDWSKEMFTGLIDNVRIYNVALSQSQILTDMYTPIAPAQPPTRPTRPTAPTKLTATAVSQSQINLSWTASTANVPITGYLVYRENPGSTSFGDVPVGTTNGSTTTYTDTGLAASSTYSYEVWATDAAGNSPFSNVASATTQTPTPPSTGALANVQLTAGWATFGEALPDGVASSGLQIGSLVTQTDVKTTWPDGSIRYAIVSANVPANGTYPITAAALTTGSFTPTLPNASVQFNIGGTTYTATVPSTPSSDTWLKGPLVVEGRYVVIPVQSNGTPHPFLDVIFDVRTYSDGKSRLDVTGENVLDQSNATRVRYGVDIFVNSQVVYHHDTFDHYWATRWRKVFDIGLTESQVTLDFTPFYQANAIPQYMSIVANIVNSPTGSSFDILQAGNVNTDMPAHGGRAELAPYPDWTARYLVYQNPTQRSDVLANGDLSGSWPVHLREPNDPTSPGGPTYQGIGTNKMISINERPNFWYDNRADAGNMPAVSDANYPSGYDGTGPLGSPLIPDVAHEPSIAYVPYLVTGDRYYADEIGYWANYVLIRTYQNSYSNPRGGSQGLLAPNEVRGIGWGLRNLADAAAYLPNNDPAKAYFIQKVNNNLSWMDTYAASVRGPSNPFGIVFPDARPENQTDPSHAWIALWEQEYLTWAIDHANKQGFNGGLQLRDQIGQFVLKFFTSPDIPLGQEAPYVVSVGARSGLHVTYYTTVAQIWSNGTNNNTRPLQGYYGPETRLTLMIGVQNGWAGAQDAYDYLNPIEATTPYVNGVSDLANRAGWAIALNTTGLITSGAASAASIPSAGLSRPGR